MPPELFRKPTAFIRNARMIGPHAAHELGIQQKVNVSWDLRTHVGVAILLTDSEIFLNVPRLAIYH